MAEKQHSAHQPSGTVHARNCLVQGAVDEGKQLKKYVWGPPWVSSANYPRHGMLTYCLYHMVTWVIFSLFWEKFFFVIFAFRLHRTFTFYIKMQLQNCLKNGSLGILTGSCFLRSEKQSFHVQLKKWQKVKMFLHHFDIMGQIY